MGDPITIGAQRVTLACEEADAAPDFTPEMVERLLAECDGQIVYFLQMGEDGPIKIGATTTERLKTRISVVQTGSPYRLKLLGTTPGTRRLESRLHALFGHLRMQGEWFFPHPQLVGIAQANPLQHHV